MDIDRLNYIKKNAVFQNKDEVFLNTLKASKSKYPENAISALYDFEIANLYVQQGRNYNPITNSEPRWKLKGAIEICNSVIESFPDSRIAEKCQVLKKTVLTKSLNITSESVIPENQFSRLLVRYTNLNHLKVTIYDVGVGEISRFNKIYDADDKLMFLKNKDVVKQFKSSLKDEGDYQNHTTEIIVPKLKNGHYIILAETDTNQNTFATQTLQVTDFALVDNSSDEFIRYQIINRNNGKPVPNVSAELKYQTKYNGSYKRERLISNPNGFIGLEKTYERYQNLSVTLKKEDRTAYYNGFYAYRYTRGNKKTIDYKGFLFTDRSIYRPGQIVYFKAIAMSHEEEKSSVLPNHEVYVSLYDTNDEEVKELILKTNEFGSVSGEFILPNSGLNGDYYLELDSKSDNIDLYTEHYFSVEEYKRPRFETNFEPVTESFKVNDSISVIGKALAYAGSTITDAKVVYRVKRNVQYPRWYHYYQSYYNNATQEITNGETKTDEKGEFEITFLAQPDNSVDKDNLPIFNYEITADVTDINGETRRATTFVNVGYHSLLVTVSVGNQLDKTKKDHKIAIDTRNLNGEFVAANGQLKIYKLKSPDRILRNRPWSAPDYQVIPEGEFKEKFPHEAYADEANPNNWERGRLVFESNFDTETSKEITLGNIKKWESGKYIITLQSEDKFGQTVKDESRFEVFRENDKTLSDNELF
ncbi:MAG: MG2 domain-containing protein, partial [Bacteroidota bacterium]